jgi:3-oxoacyl-[acyl-carrier-protein] synthase-3
MSVPQIFIKAIGSQIASGRVDNVEQAAQFGKDAAFVDLRIGARQLPDCAGGETATSLAISASQIALSKAELSGEKIGLLVFVTQNPDHGGLPHNSAILHGKLGLQTSAMCFDLGLGCSGFVYGLSIVSSLMQTQKIKHALLVTSDQYRAKLIDNDTNTNLLFGDAACATVLSQEGILKVVDTRLGTDGSAYRALIREEDGIIMNGRAVFGFSRTVIPDAIKTFCDDLGLGLDNVDQFLLHQGSRAILEEIASKLGLQKDRVPIEMGATGNTISSSLPLLLERRIDDKTLHTIILAGFGVGLSWGTAFLERA